MNDLDPPEPEADLEAWWMAVVLLLFYVLSMVDRTMIVMLVEPIKAHLKLSDFQMSLILGPAFGLAYALISVPAGWAADTWPRRWVAYGAVTFWGLMTVASGLATSFAALFAARALIAVGEGMLAPCAYSLMSDRFPRKRLASAMAAYSMGPKIGQSVAYLSGALALAAATAIVAHHTPFLGAFQPWQIVFFIVGAPAVVLAFLAFSYREPARQRGEGKAREDANPAAMSYVWAHRTVFLPILFGFGLVNLSAGAIASWTPSYMTRAFGWTAVHYGPILGLVGALGAFSMLPKGMLVDWLYGRGMRDIALRFYTWLLAACLPIGAVIYLLHDPVLFLIGYGVVQVVVIAYLVYVSVTLQLITPSQFRGRVTGLLLMILSLASQTLGPTTVAALSDFVFRDPSKLGWALAVVIGVTLTGALILLRYALRTIQPLLQSSNPV